MQEKEIIFGAPGCGKTTYLLDVLEKELKTTKPERIAFVSFTKKGAQEGLNRAKERFQRKEQEFKYFRTLHSICFKELRVSRYDMLGRQDYKNFSEAMNMNFIGYYTEEFFHNDDRYLYLYFLKQNNYEMYKIIRDSLKENVEKIKHVANNYNRYKKQFGKRDFTDLLVDVLRQEIVLDIDVAIIDEAQDLTTLQWQVCDMLFSKAKKVYIAGDDDQAIYEWTGADINYFLGIEGKRVILDKSWRLRTNLLTFAKKISAMIDHRVDKDFEPYEDGGNILYYNSIDEVEFNDEESYYCLSRNNYYLKRYEHSLRKKVKLYTRKGRRSVNPDIISAINNFEKFKNNELGKKDEAKVLKLLRNDLLPNLKGVAWYNAFVMEQDDILYYRQLIQNKVKIVEPKITISTIHGVKGGEADNVVLLLDVTKTVYQQLYTLNDSELRCLYVACTRAKNNLHIVHSKTKHSYGDIIKELTNECNL